MRLALHWQILIAMTLGAVFGIGLNRLSGDLQMLRPIDHPGGLLQLIGMEHSIEVPEGRVWTADSTARILIQVEPRQLSDSRVEHAAVRRIVVGDEQLVARRLSQEGEPWPDLFLEQSSSLPYQQNGNRIG